MWGQFSVLAPPEFRRINFMFLDFAHSSAFAIRDLPIPFFEMSLIDFASSFDAMRKIVSSKISFFNFVNRKLFQQLRIYKNVRASEHVNK